MGAYPNAQNQWPAGYAQPQAWPQASQTQTQQWNAGYAQQVCIIVFPFLVVFGSVEIENCPEILKDKLCG